MAQHYVQAVGGGSAASLSLVFSHTLLTALFKADNVSLTGFKLEGNFLSTAQLLDNSKIVPLLNGDTITVTNTNKSGSLSFSATRASGSLEQGDIVAISHKLLDLGDGNGGTLVASYTLNGKTFKVTFYGVTVKSAPPLNLMGNDVPDYSVEWNYGDYKVEY
jgi:hypothetical protein